LEGEVWLDNERVLGPAFNIIPGHEDMKFVSQDFYVLDNHTVQENIFDKMIGYTDEVKQKRSARILKLLDLVSLKNTRAKHLSSGQRQRVAIARAIAVIPKVLLLDEPFSNLDKILSEKLFSFIAGEVKKHNTSVILITHNSEEALKYADSIAVMDHGKLVQMGEKWKVYYRPKNTKLAGLLGDFNIVRPEDLEKKSRQKHRSKLLLRPDKIQLAQKDQCDLVLRVTASRYNGKCFESLGETLSGNALVVYTHKQLTPEKNYFFSIAT
jgi:iron(III) transport system ATP-binding protein